MMKLLALAVFVVCVNAGAQFNGLFATPSIAVTSTNIDSSTGYAITVLTKPTTYESDDDFDVTFNVTWTGTLPDNITPGAATLAITGPGSVYSPSSSGDCAAEPLILGVGTRISANLATYTTSTFFKLTVAGTYTATISVRGAPASFTFTVAQAGVFTPPTGTRPTVATFLLPGAPSAAGIDVQINATLTPSTIDATQSYSITVVFTAGSPQGVAWMSSCLTANGVCNEFSELTPYAGGWCGDAFTPQASFTGLDFPAGTALTVRSVTVAVQIGGTTYTNSFGAGAGFLAGHNAITITSGDTDTTPPTCSAIAFASNAVSTNNVGVAPVVTTITCADGAQGSGVNTWFAIVSGPDGAVDQLVSNQVAGVTSTDIELFHSYTINVKGVGAIDGAGNAVVYGSCGSYANAFGTVCGGGSSSSSTVVASMALVVMCILALLAW